MSTELEDFLKDANRFVLKHIQMIDNTPLQVYCSGLAFSPTDSIIRRIFNNQRPNWIPALPQVQKSWSAELQTLEGHSFWVSSVAFSPDGQRIVSGSNDKTIKLWDAQTGSELQTLEGHSNSVVSAASFGYTQMEHEQDSQISVEDSWVCLRGKSVIWLPPEFRGPQCHAIKHDVLALGYPTGRVLVIGFCAPSD